MTHGEQLYLLTVLVAFAGFMAALAVIDRVEAAKRRRKARAAAPELPPLVAPLVAPARPSARPAAPGDGLTTLAL